MEVVVGSIYVYFNNKVLGLSALALPAFSSTSETVNVCVNVCLVCGSYWKY